MSKTAYILYPEESTHCHMAAVTAVFALLGDEKYDVESFKYLCTTEIKEAFVKEVPEDAIVVHILRTNNKKFSIKLKNKVELYFSVDYDPVQLAPSMAVWQFFYTDVEPPTILKYLDQEVRRLKTPLSTPAATCWYGMGLLNTKLPENQEFLFQLLNSEGKTLDASNPEESIKKYEWNMLNQTISMGELVDAYRTRMDEDAIRNNVTYLWKFPKHNNRMIYLLNYDMLDEFSFSSALETYPKETFFMAYRIKEDVVECKFRVRKKFNTRIKEIVKFLEDWDAENIEYYSALGYGTCTFPRDLFFSKKI